LREMFVWHESAVYPRPRITVSMEPTKVVGPVGFEPRMVWWVHYVIRSGETLRFNLGTPFWNPAK
jgi:hypothetical protein